MMRNWLKAMSNVLSRSNTRRPCLKIAEQQRRKLLHLERLEDRETPSATIISTGTSLSIVVPATETAVLNISSGSYTVTDSALSFTPLFPFDSGRAYLVAFDPAHLPHPRQSPPISTVVRLAALESHPTTTVTAIYPSGESEVLLKTRFDFNWKLRTEVAALFLSTTATSLLSLLPLE